MNSKIFSLLFLLALFMTACNDDKIIFFENHVKEEDNGGSGAGGIKVMKLEELFPASFSPKDLQS